jgi:mycofactocin precursor
MELKESQVNCEKLVELQNDNPDILEEIEIEDLTVDGICGVY